MKEVRVMEVLVMEVRVMEVLVMEVLVMAVLVMEVLVMAVEEAVVGAVDWEMEAQEMED